MAYRNLINAALGANKHFDAFIHIRDFLAAAGAYTATGIGWTIVDAYYQVSSTSLTANDWVRLRTSGESGQDRYEIIMKVGTLGLRFAIGFEPVNLTNNSAGYIKTVGSLASEAINTSGSWTGIYIYGNLDFVAIICPISAANAQTMRFGIINDLQNPSGTRHIERTTGAVTAGTNKSITVANSDRPLWKPGNRIQILDPMGGETALIISNDVATDTLVLDELYYGYSANAYVSTFFPYYLDVGLGRAPGAGMGLLLNFALTGQPFSGSIGVANSQQVTLQTNDYGPSPITLRYNAQLLTFSPLQSPAWHGTVPNIMRGFKFATDATIFPLGAENWRYFSANGDTTGGYYYREV